MSKLTKKDIVSQLEAIVDPQSGGTSKLGNLIDLITRMPSTPLMAQPTVNTEWPPKPQPTNENIAATIANPELPRPKSVPFKGGLK
jgi:hypothetical protein